MLSYRLLLRVFLLIDARHGLKAADAEAMDALDQAAVSYELVLTKADKLKPAAVAAELDRSLQAVSRRPAAFPRALASSAETGQGIADLRAEVAEAAFA